ncbi:MAG: hypothetical protein ACK6CU_23595 [Deltaproteobacteria bacterium]
MSHGESTATRRLREQIEQALASSRSRKVLEPLLERLAALAAPGSESSLLAHRHLAEYRLQDHPWRALLHLKHVLKARPDDDVAHAMQGLAHAMSGHYRSAVAAYRAAAAAAPENPWYHHNLGHILDVALDQPAPALPHLRAAFATLGEEEPEVAASLVHCLARLPGRGIGAHGRGEALAILSSARRRHPKHPSLLELATKLGAGPIAADASPRRSPRAVSPIPLQPRARSRKAAAESRERVDEDPVIVALRARLGAHPTRFDTAKEIWSRYCETQPRARRGRPRNTDVLAAAVHRIVMHRTSGGGVTLAAIARAYGVDPKAVAQRSQEIEQQIER